jgi:hypothetical protein
VGSKQVGSKQQTILQSPSPKEYKKRKHHNYVYIQHISGDNILMLVHDKQAEIEFVAPTLHLQMYY